MSPLAKKSLTRRRTPGRGEVELAHRTIGNAMVVHAKDKLTDEAMSLAMAVAPDPDNELVVVDLPTESPIGVWESLAECLPRGRRGVRLVLGGRSREATALAGQWLSQRLKRPVVAPDGVVLRGAGGCLFVHLGKGSGWVRFEPGRPPQWEAKRFPRPSWESGVLVDVFPTSATAAAEPLPGGVWLRPAGYETQMRAAMPRLVRELPCQPDVLTVVLGCPGTPAISVDDVLRLLAALPESTRHRIRFVEYGPVRGTYDMQVGQLLADALSGEVLCYTGLPTTSPSAPDVVTVRADGSLGWRTFAELLAYRPQASGELALPEVRGYRQPVPGVVEVAPATYWYSQDAVLEIVPAGLWIRPTNYLVNSAVVRGAPTHADENLVVFDGEDGEQASRMRLLALDVLGRLDDATRQVSRMMPATAMSTARVRITGRALARVTEPTVTSDEAIGALVAEALTEAMPVARPSVAEPTEAGEDAVTVAALATEAPTVAVLASRPDVEPAVVDQSALAAVVMPAEPDDVPTPVVEAPAPPADDIAPPAAPMSMRLESAPTDGPADTRDADTGNADTKAAEETPAVPVATVQKSGARVQPTPTSAASALLPTKGIDEERTWLRKNLGAQFGVLANTIARVLSEHPGIQGDVSRFSADVLTEAVAVRLYLSDRGADLDAALRTATVGPHVPFARCVVAGLRKLPSHRGATIFRMTPTSAQWELYRAGRLLTDWGFVNALIEPCAAQDGEVDVLVWSMTSRRTKLLEPDEAAVEDRVLFVPGTSFKVLDVSRPKSGERGQILLRELAASEIGSDGKVDSNRISLDELAMKSLRRSAEKWAGTKARQRVPDSSSDRFQALPGLA